MNSKLLEKGTKLHELVEEVNNLPLDDKAIFVQWVTGLTIRMQREEIHWIDRIPMRLKNALIRYRDEGIETGDAMKALLCNDLKSFARYADNETWSCAHELLWWLQRFMPGLAWGSSKLVLGWIEHNGLRGLNDLRKIWQVKVENELHELERDSEI